MLYHIPNEGKRSVAYGASLLRQGLKKGVPDICLPVARGEYHALYIELKRRSGGKVSESQSEWIKRLSEAGNKAVVCEGWEKAAAEIMEYLRK